MMSEIQIVITYKEPERRYEVSFQSADDIIYLKLEADYLHGCIQFVKLHWATHEWYVCFSAHSMLQKPEKTKLKDRCP